MACVHVYVVSSPVTFFFSPFFFFLLSCVSAARTVAAGLHCGAGRRAASTRNRQEKEEARWGKMPPKQDNVQRLLAAEQKRNKIIADAKARRQAKVKQAKIDAEQEVAAFRREKEQEYEQYRAQQLSGADAENLELARGTELQLQELRTLTAKRMNYVEDMMAALILQGGELKE
ncbi:(H)-ATPase G subunit [Trypanosoma cruzi Dm28c]|nr:(H)-ATPase G subunit [Trypanosoma cruzi Dm28c]